MARRTAILICALIAALAVIAVLWGMRLEANRRLHDQEDSSQRLQARLNQLEVDNLRLSNAVVQANTPLADVQLAGLAKLQEEVRALRKRTNDLQRLQVEIRQLRSKLTSVLSNTPPDVPAADIYPRDKWAFAGYDSPEAALQSVTWAISQGDEDAYMASLSPELRDEMQDQLADGSFAESGPTEMSDATGYRIVNRESISGDRRIITVYTDGEGKIVQLVFENTPNGWRVVGENGDDNH